MKEANRKLKVNLVVNNNEITKFDIIESSDENVYKLDQIFIENITKIKPEMVIMKM